MTDITQHPMALDQQKQVYEAASVTVYEALRVPYDERGGETQERAIVNALLNAGWRLPGALATTDAHGEYWCCPEAAALSTENDRLRGLLRQAGDKRAHALAVALANIETVVRRALHRNDEGGDWMFRCLLRTHQGRRPCGIKALSDTC